MKDSGITLLELVVALCIIFLSIFLIAPRFFGGRAKSKWDLTVPQMQPIESAINAYYLNTGQYPKTFNDLITCPAGLENLWAGPYLKPKQLIDPWGYEYKYEFGYRLLSYGKDGKPGGQGENADQEDFTPITLNK